MKKRIVKFIKLITTFLNICVLALEWNPKNRALDCSGHSFQLLWKSAKKDELKRKICSFLHLESLRMLNPKTNEKKGKKWKMVSHSSLCNNAWYIHTVDQTSQKYVKILMWSSISYFSWCWLFFSLFRRV